MKTKNEKGMVNIWRKHRDMSDYVAARAYEAAFEHYRAEARGHQPKACALTGLDREVFDAVIEMCEFRLGRSNDPKSEVDEMPSLPVPELVDCLRQLRKYRRTAQVWWPAGVSDLRRAVCAVTIRCML